MSNSKKKSRVVPTVRPCALEDFVSTDGGEERHFDFITALRLAKKNINVAITGVTGAGKSTLINTLCGVVPGDQRPATQGDNLLLETQEVASYVAQKASLLDEVYTVTVWDSPGVKDGTGKGSSYMQQLQKESEDSIDILLYCIDVSQARCVPKDIVSALEVVTRIFGPSVWRHAVIILTFANVLEENIISEDVEDGDDTNHTFASRINHWEENIRHALMRAGVPDKIAREIPVEPAGYYGSGLSLPGRDHWLGNLWFQFLLSAHDKSRLAILINSQHRIRDAENVTHEELEKQQKEGGEIPIVVGRQLISKLKAGDSVAADTIASKGDKFGFVKKRFVDFAMKKILQKN